MLDILYNFGDLGLLALRVIMGIIFLAHGLPKLKNLKGTGEWLGSEGFKPGIFWATILVVLEVFGSLALMLGIYAQAVAVLFVLEMITGALWKMKKGMKLIDGYEIDLALLAGAMVVATIGTGSYAWL